MDTGRIVRVGIVGLGRSGWNIHAEGLGRVPHQYQVVAAHDPLPERLAESAAAIGARAHETLAGLLADADVDLVVVASPNKFHFAQALAALEADKHVVCEKPFGTTAAEADRLIAAAERHGRIVQPFQQRRYELDFRKVRSVLDSGVLGRFEFARICWHGFKRRWDWQTMPEMAAGELYNNGPHPIDHAMLLLGDTDETPVTPEVWCERRRGLSSGGGEDHVKMALRRPDGATVEIEISSLVAYGQDRWLVCGTAGGLHGTAARLDWKWVDWSALPARPLEPDSTPDRSYNTEVLPWHHGHWEAETSADAGGGAAPASQPVLDLYSDLHATITDGRPQVVTPQSVRRRVDVLERCAAMAPVRA